jgi:sensor domain CHASE-containing protein
MSPKAFPITTFLVFLILILGIVGLWHEIERNHNDLMQTQKHLLELTSSQTSLEGQTNQLNQQVSGLADRLSSNQFTSIHSTRCHQCFNSHETS